VDVILFPLETRFFSCVEAVIERVKEGSEA
jgi:hypothetical protein